MTAPLQPEPREAPGSSVRRTPLLVPVADSRSKRPPYPKTGPQRTQRTIPGSMRSEAGWIVLFRTQLRLNVPRVGRSEAS